MLGRPVLPQMSTRHGIGKESVCGPVGTRLCMVLSILQLGRLSQLADLEFAAVLLEHVLAVVLPELFRGILAGHAL